MAKMPWFQHGKGAVVGDDRDDRCGESRLLGEKGSAR